MATANTTIVYTPSSGRSKVNLSGWAGNASFSITPISGDQIEYPNNVNITNLGIISGSQGSYDIRHIIASTGLIEAINVSLEGNKIASENIVFETDSSDIYDRVTLIDWSGTIPFSITPISGDQIIFSSSVTVSNTGIVSAPNGTYTFFHARKDSGIIEAVSYVVTVTNTAPSLPTIPEQVVNVGDVANIFITATDPDSGTNLIYSSDVLPNGLSRTEDNIFGTYGAEQTVLTTISVQDDSGEIGNDTDTKTILFSVARAGYTITTSSVSYADLNVDSPFISAITDGDLTEGDQFDYPSSISGRLITISSDGIVTVTGTRSIVISDLFIRDSSNNYNRVGPFSITLVGTGPELTSPLSVVTDSETTTGGQVSFTSDESGDYRVIAIRYSEGTPTRKQVFDGQSPSGGAPIFDSGLQSQAATVQEIVTITGLPNQGTGYAIYSALEDQYGGISLFGPVTLTTDIVGVLPLWSSVPDQSYTEGTPINTLDFNSYVSNAVTINIVSGLDAQSGLNLDPDTGILSGTPNEFDASGVPGSTTSRQIVVEATNPTGTSSTFFTADFYRLNPPTTIMPIANQQWKESVAVSLAIESSVSGATSYDLQYDNSGTFEDATGLLIGYGLNFNSSSGLISGAPNSTMPPASPIIFRARGVNSDGNGEWLEFTSNISSLAAPTFNGPIPQQNLTEGEIFNGFFDSYFSNESTFTSSGLPLGSGLTVSSNGSITGTPNSNDVIASPITVILTALNTDGQVSGNVILNVAAASLPILIAGFPDISLSVGSAINIPLSSYIGNANTYTVTGLPLGTGINVTTNYIGGTFSQSDSDAAPFVVIVRGSNSNGFVEDSFQISSLDSTSEIKNIFDPVAQFVKFWGDPYVSIVNFEASNWTQIQLYNNGEPHLLNNYTDIKLKLTSESQSFEVSSQIYPNLFDIKPGNGKFNARIGEINAPKGFYCLDVFYKDLKHPSYVVFTAYRSLIVEVR